METGNFEKNALFLRNFQRHTIYFSSFSSLKLKNIWKIETSNFENYAFVLRNFERKISVIFYLSSKICEKFGFFENRCLV